MGPAARRAVRRHVPVLTLRWRLARPALGVGDLGCGTGQVRRAARAVRRAGHRRRRVGRDAGRRRGRGSRGTRNVDVRRGDLEALPIDDGQLDAATLMLVLHHVPDPARALAEVARVLRAGRPAADRRHAAARPRATTGSRWATCGSVSPRRRSRRAARERGLRATCASMACRPRRRRRARRCFALVATSRRRFVTLPKHLLVRGETHGDRARPCTRSTLPGRRAANPSRSRTSRWPSSAARRSASPSRRCPA